MAKAETTAWQRLPTRIVKKVATYEGVTPTALTPLHEVLDPTALSRLFRPGPDARRQSGQVSFPYCGYRVTVHADGTVDVSETDS